MNINYNLNYGNNANLTENLVEDIPDFFLNFDEDEITFASFNFRGKIFSFEELENITNCLKNKEVCYLHSDFDDEITSIKYNGNEKITFFRGNTSSNIQFTVNVNEELIRAFDYFKESTNDFQNHNYFKQEHVSYKYSDIQAILSLLNSIKELDETKIFLEKSLIYKRSEIKEILKLLLKHESLNSYKVASILMSRII